MKTTVQLLSTEYNLYNTSANLLDKNISSFTGTLKTTRNIPEENLQINHLYLKENILVSNVDDLRYSKVVCDIEIEKDKNEYLTEEEKRKRYNNEEDDIFCGKFPHLSYCGCKFPCAVLLKEITSIKINDQIYVGPIESAYKTKELLKLRITHILNVSCTAYNRRKYFKYLDIFVSDNHTENAIKFFKITNRFIDDAVKKGGKIMIHSVQGRSRCWVFLIAYLIGRCRMKYVKTLDFVKERFPYADPNDNFLTQLKHYDLEVNV